MQIKCVMDNRLLGVAPRTPLLFGLPRRCEAESTLFCARTVVVLVITKRILVEQRLRRAAASQRCSVCDHFSFALIFACRDSSAPLEAIGMRNRRVGIWSPGRSIKMLVLVPVVLALSCGGGDDDVDASACERARDRVIDLRLADATGVDREAHRDVMRRAIGDSFMSACAGSWSDSQVSCVLNAPDAATANACVPAPSAN